MQRQHQKPAEQDCQMQHHDASVWLLHELWEAGVPVFPGAKVIGGKRYAAADGQPEDCPTQIVVLCDAPEGPRGGKSGTVSLVTAKHGNDQNAMNEGEHSVMETEKRDEK